MTCRSVARRDARISNTVQSAATVITALSWGSRAIELGNGMWRKRLLPVGSVEYKGRQLHFTRNYLAGLVDAFRDKAYDFCPVQIADSSNQHTNAPEATSLRTKAAPKLSGTSVLPSSI